MLLSVSRQAKIINNRYQKGLGGVLWSPWRSSFLCCSFSFTPSAHAFVSLPITHSQTLPGAAEGQLVPWDVTYLLHVLNGWQPAAGWWECTSIQWVSRIWTDRNWSLVHSPWLPRKSVQSLPSHIWSCDKAAASSSRYMKLTIHGTQNWLSDRQAQQSTADAPLQGSTAEPLLSAQDYENKPVHLKAPFSICTENRESKVLTSHAAGCRLRFPAKANKGLADFLSAAHLSLGRPAKDNTQYQLSKCFAVATFF